MIAFTTSNKQIQKCSYEATDAIGKRKVNANATNLTKFWFCQEVKGLALLECKSYLKYKSASTPEAGTKYKHVRKEVNTKIKNIKR